MRGRAVALALLAAAALAGRLAGLGSPRALDPQASPPGPGASAAAPPASGCVSCHTRTDSANAHESPAVRIGCADCHGGNASIVLPPGAARDSRAFDRARTVAHVQPRYTRSWKSSGDPESRAALWRSESAEFVRFVNPGDLRVADEACGTPKCHPKEVKDVATSMMRHGAMLWGAALYNNGAYPFKNSAFGEFYGRDGVQAAAATIPAPTPEETRTRGILPWLSPLPRWEITQPGNVLRVFERGGRPVPEIGNPDSAEVEAGRPEDKLSSRGLGTLLRTDPVFLGLQKTRLHDPTLNMPGTNDHPGDYRSSGCTGCHAIYANDRDPAHSGPYAGFGHLG